jgi:hypothetical protein
LLGDDAVQNQRQTGRNDDADRSRRADDTKCERQRIAALEHRGDQDRSHGHRRRHARTANGRKQRAGDDRDEAERSGQSAEPGRGEIDERMGNAAETHEGCGHHEERQRHQGRRVQLVDDELGCSHQRLAGQHEHGAGAQPEHQEHRHSRRKEAGKERQEARHLRLNRCRAGRGRRDSEGG